MKLAREILNHFSCDQCKYWTDFFSWRKPPAPVLWSVASAEFELGDKVYCPWCAAENVVSEIDSGGNVKASELPRGAR